ncbi:MAG TPA: penicillin-binding transpeptidase domain-containing protein [Nannocystaceae bacterium]|nr:penicillin-binding transpeptidase domain-containing protein [Nannocystaceae bacterium]
MTKPLLAITALVLTACPRSNTTVEPASDPPPAKIAAKAPQIDHAGCFLLARVDGSEAITVHPDDCAKATVPASTFKVPHALIALQTGVIADPTARVKWDGTKYPDMKAWEADQDLRSAIRESVVWYFQRTAEAIGRERMSQWLGELHYGNADASGEIRKFWLEAGSLQVTGTQQLDFWQRFAKGELPIDPAHMKTVMNIVEAPIDFWNGRLPEGESAPPTNAVLHAKTGTAWDDAGTVSWWAGTVDGPRGKWVFVSRVVTSEPYPGWSAAVREGMKALAQAQVL